MVSWKTAELLLEVLHYGQCRPEARRYPLWASPTHPELRWRRGRANTTVRWLLEGVYAPFDALNGLSVLARRFSLSYFCQRDAGRYHWPFIGALQSPAITWRKSFRNIPTTVSSTTRCAKITTFQSFGITSFTEYCWNCSLVKIASSSWLAYVEAMPCNPMPLHPGSSTQS